MKGNSYSGPAKSTYMIDEQKRQKALPNDQQGLLIEGGGGS
jgi:hypothetical protein